MPRPAGLEDYRELGMQGWFSSLLLTAIARRALSFSLSQTATESEPPVVNVEDVTLYDVYHRNIGRRLRPDGRRPRLYKTSRTPVAEHLSGLIQVTDIRLNEVDSAGKAICVEGSLVIPDPGELSRSKGSDYKRIMRILNLQPHVSIKQNHLDFIGGLPFGNHEPYIEPYEHFDELVILGSLKAN